MGICSSRRISIMSERTASSSSATKTLVLRFSNSIIVSLLISGRGRFEGVWTEPEAPAFLIWSSIEHLQGFRAFSHFNEMVFRTVRLHISLDTAYLTIYGMGVQIVSWSQSTPRLYGSGR